ncbi:hypothetical protein GCM10007389_29540 [Pontibacter akesuensis]|nr:hypothetical protein GCM10007389_29540 [Pontibacter akesuensis]
MLEGESAYKILYITYKAAIQGVVAAESAIYLKEFNITFIVYKEYKAHNLISYFQMYKLWKL